MHNSKAEIIYVGKAIKLCNRVRQYFQDSRNLSVKIQHMVKNVAYFEYIITDSELEALVLENNLIKEHHPKYNTKLKDDKGYPYIKVTVNEEFPRIMLARKMKADGGKYFGPYTSAGAVNDTIELLRKIFKIRTCNRRLPKDTGKDRPCLYYQICLLYTSIVGPKDSFTESLRMNTALIRRRIRDTRLKAVSYTHLDVYKRQIKGRPSSCISDLKTSGA